ncbi:MAG: GTP cyclohydrolase I FolE [bacterium]|nr:GTP cyclohydrolase I FolE [bacterium]
MIHLQSAAAAAQTIQEDPIELITHDLIAEIGEDPGREGLLRTPRRVAKAWRDLTAGYDQDLNTILNGAVFEEAVDEMVILTDISFFSLCEHHLLPFFGRAHVAYIPNGKVVGLSKIPRVVEMFARRLQLQERLTQQIAQAIDEAIEPRGVAVVTEAEHMCMMMRGVQKTGVDTRASAMLGAFRDNASTRSEFLSMLPRRT